MPRAPKLDNAALDIPFVPIVIIPYLCDFLYIGGGEQAPGEQLNCMRGCKGRLNKDITITISLVHYQAYNRPDPGRYQTNKVINDRYSLEHDLASNRKKAMATEGLHGDQHLFQPSEETKT